MPLGAERVNLAVMDCGRSPWAVAIFHVPVVARIGIHPERLARGFVEAQDTLDLRIELMIGDEDPPLRDDRPRVTVAHPRPPTDLKSRGGENGRAHASTP